ncbi:MAG: nitrite reductase, copper-containing [Candidatus Nitrohelix vancouverensis]|uniref:Copper-containing nitrite reductase n=1 Tax=Candidatus Nitrohelix vancouverensis TaxID=2705534 RepID=A0A7T0C0P8_9BACT|nr:MAG: nitrite reductase, copper-containing [Candidatus Nitrohelix vancouverensis]
MKTRYQITLFSMFTLLFNIFSVSAVGAEIQASLATAPNVPAPVKHNKPETVVIKMQAKEYIGDLDEGVKYGFWSYDGTVPGPMARVRVGDTVQFHLSNASDSTQPHNIDIHAVNGAHGGAALSMVSPGEVKIFSFNVMAPGLYIYHCAAGSIVDHIANGMYGLILVEPEGGLPKVDKEFYVMQSEFFTTDPEDGLASFDFQRGLDENPTYVVFNGKNGALVDTNALKATVGETVRIFFGNVGPNSVSSFHVIGEIFDSVYVEGGIGGTVTRNIQTTLVPAAGSTIVEFKVDYPGSYVLVDHSIFRVAKGALGHLVVDGPKNEKVVRAGK